MKPRFALNFSVFSMELQELSLARLGSSDACMHSGKVNKQQRLASRQKMTFIYNKLVFTFYE